MLLAFLNGEQPPTSDHPAAGAGQHFLLGYLAIWTVYSAVAALAQWWLHKAALLSPLWPLPVRFLSADCSSQPAFFQWTPLKRACLKGCRSPLSFLMERMARRCGRCLRHGITAWFILPGMLLDADGPTLRGGRHEFVLVAMIALFVMAEKMLARGELLGHLAGVAMVTAGIALVVRLW